MQTTENKYMHRKKLVIYDVTLALVVVPAKALLTITRFAVRTIYHGKAISNQYTVVQNITMQYACMTETKISIKAFKNHFP
jgi:uncharacterized membrane protein